MAYIAISEAKVYYEENHDKCAFVKNIISDNILPGDIYVRAKELHFVTDVTRMSLWLSASSAGRKSPPLSCCRILFPDKQHDFVISVSETDIALIKEINTVVDAKYVQKACYATIESKAV